MGSVAVVVLVAAALVAVAMLLLVIAVASGPREPTGVAKSLAMIEAGTFGQSHLTRSELPAQDRLVEPVLRRFTRLADRLSQEGTEVRITRMLDKAGNPTPWTVERILGVKGLCLLLGGLLGFVYGGLSLRGLVLAVVLGAALFYLPNVLLYNAGIRRQEAARVGLAEALDMLTVCVEAGQGFDAALHQVARNIEGPISGEFARALSEIQIGRSRGEAFAGLGERIDTPEVRSFVTALVQADRLGLPIGQVLREQTANMRLARRQRAEEQAQKVTVKILFPLMFCILPALMVVVIGPGIIRLIGAFTGLN